MSSVVVSKPSSDLNHSHHFFVSTGHQTHAISIEDKRKYLIKLLENMESLATEDMYNEELIARVCEHLKSFGIDFDEDLESRQQIDLYFNVLRNLLRNTKLNAFCRTMIMEVIELRASKWRARDDMDHYYRQKLQHFSLLSNGDLKTSQSSGAIFGYNRANDVFKCWLKSAKPTKLMGKALFKDEVVIRNSDSGKVMGIKGRRVAIIEEMSDTVISFQKVSPGSNERLVQITGPTEDNIERAKQLIEATIERNSSPVPFESPHQSYCSLNAKNNLNENSIFDTNNCENVLQMKYCFTFNVHKEVIQLLTNDRSIGLKAKQLLQEFMTESHSHDNSLDAQNECKCKSHSNGKQIPTQESVQSFEPIIQRSVSQQTVANGRTSLPFVNTEQVESESHVSNQKMITRIVFERQFLLSFAELPLSELKPNFEMMSNLYTNGMEIIRKSDQQNKHIQALD